LALLALGEGSGGTGSGGVGAEWRPWKGRGDEADKQANHASSELATALNSEGLRRLIRTSHLLSPTHPTLTSSAMLRPLRCRASSRVGWPNVELSSPCHEHRHVSAPAVRGRADDVLAASSCPRCQSFRRRGKEAARRLPEAKGRFSGLAERTKS
jgi:hypothetical protein